MSSLKVSYQYLLVIEMKKKGKRDKSKLKCVKQGKLSAKRVKKEKKNVKREKKVKREKPIKPKF